MLSEVLFGPVLTEPDSRAHPFVWINSGKIENTLFFSLKGFSSFTLKSVPAFFYVTWECLGRQIVMLTEVEKRSSELSVCSNNKQVSARCSAYGLSRKLLTKQFSLLHLDTPSFSPVCHSYHSLVVVKLSCSSFHLYEYDWIVLSEYDCEHGTVKSIYLAVDIQSWTRSAQEDDRTANVVLMGERTCHLPDLVCFFSK